MTDVKALVGSAIGSKSPLDGLLELYNGYAVRSRVERMRMRRELAYIKDETLFDTRALFALDDAWRMEITPVVALAPIKATKVGFGKSGDRAYFEAHTARVLNFDVPASVIERKQEAERQEIAKMDKWQLEHHYRMQMFMPRVFFSRETPSHEAAVPPTPKAILPWNPLTRRKLYTLFDADWKALPVDPYLLERKNAHQFRVVGHWDLTPQERKIMELIGR